MEESPKSILFFIPTQNPLVNFRIRNEQQQYEGTKGIQSLRINLQRIYHQFVSLFANRKLYSYKNLDTFGQTKRNIKNKFIFSKIKLTNLLNMVEKGMRTRICALTTEELWEREVLKHLHVLNIMSLLKCLGSITDKDWKDWNGMLCGMDFHHKLSKFR